MSLRRRVREFDDLMSAVDLYFSRIEAQRERSISLQVRATAEKRVDAIRHDQRERVSRLQNAVCEAESAAELVACNAEDIDKVLSVLRSALASGMDWAELNQLIKAEQTNSNPVASLIYALKLETNMVSLLLWDEQRGDAQRPATMVDIDIALSAHANVRRLYDVKKAAAEKARRTAEAAAKAVEDAERKSERAVAKQAKTSTMRTMRKVLWFERFHWFLTTEGLLVLSGRDAQQNELIVKRYLRPGDAYIHADVHGAASCVLRNPHPCDPLPAESLKQAGALTASTALYSKRHIFFCQLHPPHYLYKFDFLSQVCRSVAWGSRVVTSAWWVKASQVSKTAPTGEYLSTGSFMIRGKKNFLPPTKLEMCFGFIFKLDDTQPSFASRPQEWSALDLAEKPESPESGHKCNGPEICEESSPMLCRSIDKPLIEDVVGSADATENTLPPEGPEPNDLARLRWLDVSSNVGGATSDKNASTSERNAASRLPIKDVGLLEATRNSGTNETSGENIPGVHSSSCANDQKWDATIYSDGHSVEADSSKVEEKFANSDSIFETVDLKKKTETRIDHQTSASIKLGVRGRLSAYERRSQRKAQQYSERKDSVGSASQERTPGKRSNERQLNLKQSPLSSPAQPPKRGRRGKLRKQKRYANQSEEERKLAMAALGNALPALFSEPEDSISEPITVQHRMTREGAKSYTHDKAQCSEAPPGKTCFTKISHPEVLVRDVKVALGGEAALRAFTARPTSSDVCLFALPFCGPSSSMSHFKYRVKLTPGSMKKGAAAKMAVELFSRNQSAGSRERNLIQSVTNPEIVQCIVGGVKLSAPGLAATQKAQRQKKRGKGKCKAKGKHS